MLKSMHLVMTIQQLIAIVNTIDLLIVPQGALRLKLDSLTLCIKIIMS
jgi:hypothetical protein